MRSILGIFSALTLLAACGGAPGPQGPAGAAGEACEVVDNGGSATITCPGSDPVTVFSGLDGQNGEDGTNGTDGVKGDNGSNGSNGSNGTNGEDGEDGFSTLAIANDEPAGSNCTYGGTKISMGLDNGDGGGTAHDGVLQAGEIDSVYYVCHGDGGDAKLAVGQPCVSTDECIDTATCVALTEDSTESAKCRANCDNGGTCDSGFNCVALNSAASTSVTALDQLDADATESTSACGPEPSSTSSWQLTIVSAEGGTCGGAGGCSDLYVQVNGDNDNESGTVNDDDDDNDIVDPVWNHNAGTFSYAALESMTIKIFEDDLIGDDLYYEGTHDFQSPWTGLSYCFTQDLTGADDSLTTITACVSPQ